MNTAALVDHTEQSALTVLASARWPGSASDTRSVKVMSAFIPLVAATVGLRPRGGCTRVVTAPPVDGLPDIGGIADARISVGVDVTHDRVAVVGPTRGGGSLTHGNFSTLRREHGGRRASPHLLPGTPAAMAAARIAIRQGIRGYSGRITTACAAGARSIAKAPRPVRAGEADAVVCGGSDTALHLTVAAAFANAWALARGRCADPTSACGRFDKCRNGFVLGEGAGVLVVERADFADARGAAAHAGSLGSGGTTDICYPPTPPPDGMGVETVSRKATIDVCCPTAVLPDGVGVEAVMRKATIDVCCPTAVLSDGVGVEAVMRKATFAAGSAWSDVDCVSAQGTSPPGDARRSSAARPRSRRPGPPVPPRARWVRVGAVRAALSNSFTFRGHHNLSLPIAAPNTRPTRTTTPSDATSPLRHTRG
ncbi:beta-ketoacyl synthase N-terminal-like domain-containing protein [Actinokineospora iranica]|uniref:beta-ketoacyl synthase N-terminal-like domain-containing protein n=1 Tax=Actinokineospora iranica TaxID=1271860 RepID=UPI00158761D7|nr:beta-ketoacyl synthase N-terminal-like domain-containing protein [Actinokineospora iranica]